MPTNKPYNCRIGDERIAEVAVTAKEIGQPFPVTLRLVIDAGNPVVKKKFRKKKQ